MKAPPDLLALVRRGASPRGELLRGLGDQWRTAERAVADEDVRARPRAAGRIVASYARLAAASGEPEALARAERLRGTYLLNLGRYRDAALRFARAAPRLPEPARGHARIGLALAWTRSGRLRDAERICREVRRSAVARKDAVLAASADLHAGVAVHESGRPAAALALYRRAATAFEGAGQPLLAAVARENLANALALLDRFDEALALYDETSKTLERLGAAHEAARARYNRGALLVAVDRLGEAETELAAAERELAKGGDALAASLARLDRGEALLRAGLAAEAARLLDSAARGLAGEAPLAETVRASLLRARAAIARGGHATARRILRAAATPAARAWRADADELAGLALLGERRFAAARGALGRAAAGFGAARPVARTRALAAAGWCAFEAGDFARARRTALAAELAASRLAVPSVAFAAASLRFVVEDAAGRRAPAASALKRALAALEKTREGLGGDPMRSAVLRGRDRWFARAVRHLLAGPRGGERALALVERWRARALVDLLAARPRIDDADARTADLRARVALLERRLEDEPMPSFLRGATPPATARLARRLASAERGLHDAVVRDLRAGAAGAFDVDALRFGLPRETALVSLLADESGGLAFIVRRDRVRAVPLPVDAATVRAQVEELRFRVGKFALGPDYVTRHGRRLAAETDRVLEALAKGSVAAISEDLGDATRVVLTPHDAWRQVPFAALPFRGGRFVDAVTVAATPSFSALSTDVPVARGRPLVLAVPDAAAPGIAEEGRAVAEAAGDAVLLVGDAATRAALRASPPPRFVHVASHGRFRGELPGMSGVRLADGWLSAVDFHALDLAGSLVVLSGCETGVSGADHGAEISGLVRGVLSSGAAEVVVSLWRVDDAATTRLMTRFHAVRACGRGTEEALAVAQREAAAEGLHPWYWAGFAVWTRRAR